MNGLFLHGLAGDPWDWAGVIRHLPGVTACTPRINYFDDAIDSLEVLADSVQEVVPPTNSGEKTIVVGNSLGGMLALAMGDAFDRIVLVASHLSTSQGFLGRGAKTVRREIGRIFHNPEQLHEVQIRGYENKWDSFTRSRERFRRLAVLKRMCNRFSPEELFARTQSKITFVCGENDAISPLKEFEKLLSRFPNARLAVFPGCGHAVPLEQPRELARVLANEFSA